MIERPLAILIKAFRFDPEREAEGRFQEYEVESGEPLSVMALLSKVHEIDPTFACRTSTCFKGKCGSCLVRVNGKDALGCVTLIRPGETVVVEPCSQFTILRDVVVDFSRPQNLERGRDADEND